jgi:hypothetical protein
MDMHIIMAPELLLVLQQMPIITLEQNNQLLEQEHH